MTADVELLPMPEGKAFGLMQWNYDQAMRSYARANVEYHTTRLQAENERLRAEMERVTRELMEATTRADKLAEALEEVLRVNETDAGSDVKAWANAMLNAHAALGQEADRG